jgi:hypothetical protein
MEFADITLLECNRQQSIQAKSNNNEQEALFTCKTGNGIKLETGDTVEIMNAFISEDGCGGANMEFDGEFIFTDNGYDESGNEQKVVSVDLEYTNVKVVKNPQVVSFQNKQSVEIVNVKDNTKYENSSQKVLLKDNETTVPQRYYKTNNGEGCMFQPRRFAIALGQENNLNPPKKTGAAATVLDPKKQHPMYAYFERTDNTDTGRSFADTDITNKTRIPECDYYYMTYGGRNNYFEPTEKGTDLSVQALSQIYKPRTNNKRFTMFMRTRNYYDYDTAPNVKYYADGTTDVNFLLNDALRLDFIAGNDYVPYIELKDYKVEKGFYSPTNVAAQITEQMQQNIDYEDVDGNKQPQPETYTKSITFQNGETETHNLFSTTTTNSYFPIECGATGRDDEAIWDYLTAIYGTNNPALVPNANQKQAMEYYHSTLQYIFVKRPELFTLGRKINDMFGRISTNTSAALNDIQCFVRQDIFNVSPDPQPCVLSFEWNEPNLNNISNFLKAQNEYAAELQIGLDRYLHIMAYPDVLSFGDDGYLQAPLTAGISKASYPLYFKYQQELENIENDGLQGTDNMCFGYCTKTQIGDKYFITIHPELTQSRVSGYLDNIFVNQDDDGSGNKVIKATTGNDIGTFVGYDFHSTAFGTLIMTARNGISNGPPDSLYDQNNAATPSNFSQYVNSVCDYAVVQQDPPVSMYNTNCQRITEFLNFRYIGANNPALVYNNLTNTFGFQNLHTAENVGQPFDAGRTTTNLIAATADTPEQTVPTSVPISEQASTECYKINKRLRYWDYTPDMKPYWVSYPQHLIYVSGPAPENLPANMTLTENQTSDPDKLIYLKQDQAPTDLSIANPNIEEGAVFDAHCGIFLDVGATCPERYWKKSFWGLLGFSYEQFNPNQITIENGEQIRVGEDTMFSMKFATTNCQVVSTDLKDYPINQFGGINYSTQIAYPLAVQYNPYKKGTNDYATSDGFGLQYTPEIVQNTQSITTRGQDIPKLMTKPYYTIRTDLLDQEKYVGGNHGGINMKIMGIVDKMNGDGDYYFTEGGGMAFTITNPITITDITTAICEPSGRLAKVNENSAVIYKITKSQNTSKFNIVQQILQEEIAKNKK